MAFPISKRRLPNIFRFPRAKYLDSVHLLIVDRDSYCGPRSKEEIMRTRVCDLLDMVDYEPGCVVPGYWDEEKTLGGRKRVLRYVAAHGDLDDPM